MMQFDRSGLDGSPVDYETALQLQRRLHGEVATGTTAETMLLLEHAPVYTAGKRTTDDERPTDGTPVVDVDRGGKITWHGPGQLVGYPILRLREPVDVVGYVRRLESALIRVLGELGIAGERIEGRSGVWLPGDGTAPDRKLAAIGIRVAEGVTMHGFALNCSNSLEAYDRIVACGIRDAGVSTITEALGRTVTPQDAAPMVVAALQAEFGREAAPRAAQTETAA
ncbi:lipoate-protein ligase B [Leifsonia xyli subsp. xyli]|uniref:Octanoyltransferase n=2 Tax=Leifsonia xyli subsp. xyli TaxID=59736 RepID=LIPB_LEIXX|nr:lipoyl(octanoyl) transferase LipB [Leifsonia xyli]Q6AFG6.1 RecName: Full=Octanoyltransferase; AltName: Full=Lipoate-protein ligase B; AltName: Full=Lipoyl/octanoyl transferase; AltName: Full=Octanoyl-[acyl-carrier-protein]-protein N-octanoyltransferase [Leifsonia xyli subsp. xyli str. CTCB07]AAT88879.1 lipoate-protein ligase B [Leifsonia xyli subsp. xyli str. CTCB07]ODA90365.1 lipoate-protein ligase B [Leifsonia xyli subsp. xyli]